MCRIDCERYYELRIFVLPLPGVRGAKRWKCTYGRWVFKGVSGVRFVKFNRTQ